MLSRCRVASGLPSIWQGSTRLDTAGAWLLLRTEHDLTERGNAVEMRNLRPSFEPLIDQVRAAAIIAPARHPRPGYHTMTGFIAQIGEVTPRAGPPARTASSASSASSAQPRFG